MKTYNETMAELLSGFRCGVCYGLVGGKSSTPRVCSLCARSGWVVVLDPERGWITRRRISDRRREWIAGRRAGDMHRLTGRRIRPERRSIDDKG